MKKRKQVAGTPRRDGDLDVAPGFLNPPPGYGEVPFWWWTGEALDPDRMVAQVEALHQKGISGVQVNYSHHDTPGWPTDQDAPGIFTEPWWDVFEKVRKACVDRGMGIGLSTYTLDWPNGAHNLFWNLFYRHEKWNALSLEKQGPWQAEGGSAFEMELAPGTFAVRAYSLESETTKRTCVDLDHGIRGNRLTWKVPPGRHEVWAFHTVRKEGSFNPLMVGAGQVILDGYFQPFEDRGKSGSGLNYFFNDELKVGVGPLGWNPDFPTEFKRRKGYDLLSLLPALWQDIGPFTPKLRMDFADVRMSLMEERYFEPIFRWHDERGMIFGCDSAGRGRNPAEFGDYFRATRWYTAPGHDTPGGKADLIKGKVSSSIANLYRRPRVWLEGYHSIGWGATPTHLMAATLENYLYGCTLLNLHGFYYTTLGSHWEWAPPCFHFRMPWWAHMGEFLKYFERLSYLLSQGHTVADIALVYPVAPFEAGLDGKKATATTFDLAEKLMAAGMNFEFIDHDSLARAVVKNGLLQIEGAGAAYKVLVFADMQAVRWKSIAKAGDFTRGGGLVLSVGDLPVASDHMGSGDPALEAKNREAFPDSRRLRGADEAVNFLRAATGGGMGKMAGAMETSAGADFHFTPDVKGLNRTVRALHRKAGPREIYFVLGGESGDTLEFRATGAAELWDPWTGKEKALRVLAVDGGVSRVELPDESLEAHLVVFTPGKAHVNPPAKSVAVETFLDLPCKWAVSFVPTMDNRFGDFRLPVTEGNRVIGLEARTWAWARENGPVAEAETIPSPRPAEYREQTHGHGPKVWVLGPLPATGNMSTLEKNLSAFTSIDPKVPVSHEGVDYRWEIYDFSWRMGREGDPGHQGYHGLKGTVTDDFLCLGKPSAGLNEIRYGVEDGPSLYYIWTCALVPEACTAKLEVTSNPGVHLGHTSPTLEPKAVWLNGDFVSDHGEGLNLTAGANPLLVRYDHGGRGHLVLRKAGVPSPSSRPLLSMIWHNDPALISLDPFGGERRAEWFRFHSAPGTRTLELSARGNVQAWMDGKPMADHGGGRFEAKEPHAQAPWVDLRVEPEPGDHGGEIFPEPIRVETDGTGVMETGDWSKMGILKNYSGGVRYRTTMDLTEAQAASTLELDLRSVAGTVGVLINGTDAGVRVAPPWNLGITGLCRAGENEVVVTVYNSLSNHYQTIPSRYKGDPVSGLLGPVKIKMRRGNQTGPV